MFYIPAIKCDHIKILQILAQPLAPRPGTGQHQHPVTIFFQSLNILRQQRKIVIIGRRRLYLKIKLPFYCKFFYRHIQGGEQQHRQISQLFQYYGQRK